MKHNRNSNFPSGIDSHILKSRTLIPIKPDEKDVEDYLSDNHSKYLQEGLRIGFIDLFPEDPKNVIDEITVKEKCGNYNVSFKVRYGKVTFGPGNKMSCEGITTDRVRIGDKLPLNGFGQHSYYDEAVVMEKGIATMAKKHGLMVCKKVCSWPHAKAIVQKPENAHIRYFKQEKDENKTS